MRLDTDNRGVVLFFIVLIFASAGVIALSVMARSGLYTFLDATQQIDSWGTRTETFGCVDEFLIQLRVDEDYAPAQIDTLDAQCDLLVTTPVSGQRQAVFSWEQRDLIRHVIVYVTLSPFEVMSITEAH